MTLFMGEEKKKKRRKKKGIGIGKNLCKKSNEKGLTL